MRLRQLREAFRETQAHLAERLGVSQQTIARWEAEKSEPSIAQLRDIAVHFGTSVDEIVGADVGQGKVLSNHYCLFTGPEFDGFWGHIGLSVPGRESTLWYPISEGEAQRVRTLAFHESEEWLAIQTLNNRMLLFDVAKIRRLSLLDDAADTPDGGWELGWDAAQGLGGEIYAALEQRLHHDDEYEESTSEELRLYLDHMIKESGLSEDALLWNLAGTRVFGTDGKVWEMYAEPASLSHAVDSAQLIRPQVVNLEDDNGQEMFFPGTYVCLVDMPFREYYKGYLQDLKENEAADKRVAAPEVDRVKSPRKTSSSVVTKKVSSRAPKGHP